MSSNGHNRELRDLLRNEVPRSLFHVVLGHLEDQLEHDEHRNPESGPPRRVLVKQAAEATEIALRLLDAPPETNAQLAARFGCSVPTIDRRRRLFRDALREASQ